jgi:hypothetical protein
VTPTALASTLLALLLGLPSYWGDRREAGRVDRLRALSKDVAAVAVRLSPEFGLEPEDAAVALVALAWDESKLARHIDDGRCMDGPAGMQCDPDGRGYPRAATLWQLWRVACQAAHELPPGRERNRAAADCALTRLQAGRVMCGSLEGAHAYYRGNTCEWRQASRRVWTFRAFSHMFQFGKPIIPLGGFRRLPWVNKDRALAHWARSLLNQPIAHWDLTVRESRTYGALVEWHHSEARGWHKGVSLFVNRSR